LDTHSYMPGLLIRALCSRLYTLIPA